MVQENTMVIPELSKVLAGSEYEEHLECINRVVTSMKVVTVNDLENSVRFIGPKLCGMSTNAFISYVVQWCKNPPPEPDPVAPVKAKRKTTKKKVVKSEPEVVIDEPESAVEAQADNDNAVEDALIDLSKE
jgi:hypothetical protein